MKEIAIQVLLTMGGLAISAFIFTLFLLLLFYIFFVRYPDE